MPKLWLLLGILIISGLQAATSTLQIFRQEYSGSLPETIVLPSETISKIRRDTPVWLNMEFSSLKSLPQTFVILFSGSSIEMDFTMAIVQQAVHKATHNTLRVLLPAFRPQLDSPAIYLQEPKFKYPVEMQRARLILRNEKLPYLPSDSPLTAISLVLAKRENLAESFSRLSRDRYPALMELPQLQVMLIVICGGVLVSVLWQSRTKLGAKFLLGFLLPGIVFTAWFPLTSTNLTRDLDEYLLLDARRSLGRTLTRLEGIQQVLDSEIAKVQHKLVSEMETEITRLKKAGILLVRNESARQFLKPSQDPLDKWLVEHAEPLGIQVVMANDSTTFGSSVFQPFHGVRKVNMPMLQKVVSGEISMLGKDGNQSLSNESDQVVLQKRRDMMGMTTAMKAELREVFQDSSGLDEFLYSPWKLFDYNPLSFHDDGFKYVKNFWGYLSDAMGGHWFFLGAVGEPLIYTLLKRETNSRIKLDDNHRLAVLGFHQTVALPLLGEVDTAMMHSAALAWTFRSPSYAISDDTQGTRLALSGPCEVLGDTFWSLSLGLEPVMERRRSILNTLFLVGGLMLVGLYFVSRLLATLVLAPLYRLRQGLIRVQAGDLSTDLERTSEDELADLAIRFNRMIAGLREKELVTRFLSRMALQSLDSSDHESRREEVTVLFFGLNYDSVPWDTNSLQQILPNLHGCIHSHQGIVDKFTGAASLSIFSGPEAAKNALACISALRSMEIFSRGRHRFSCGLATGDVVLGHVGASVRKDFTCIGNTVNVAARLQTLQIEGTRLPRCIIDLATLTRAGLEEKDIRPLERIQLKGKTELVEVFEYL